MSVPPGGEAKARYVRAMFGGIVGRYDLLNDLMTFGRHRAWKRAVVRAASPAGARSLDLGSGTGDIARELSRQGAWSVTALDFVPAMLAAARRRGGEGPIDYVVGDALALPFPDNTFDRVTSGFLVRNVTDVPRAFEEMLRVLRPGGTMACLEAARRDDLLGRWLMAGFGIQARLLGRLVAGAPEAYAYLPDSMTAFHSPPELAALIHAAGFRDVRYRTRGLGLAAIHRARKPERRA